MSHDVGLHRDYIYMTQVHWHMICSKVSSDLPRRHDISVKWSRLEMLVPKSNMLNSRHQALSVLLTLYTQLLNVFNIIWNLSCWKYKINEFYFGTNTKPTNLRIHELLIFNKTTKIDALCNPTSCDIRQKTAIEFHNYRSMLFYRIWKLK
jgi:hypothetical protein